MDDRYIRQVNLPLFGAESQKKLQNTRVLVCGLGGLGCPCAVYLASMGIGTIGLCDGDTIQISNLNRQFLYAENDIGKNKAEVACSVLAKQFPNTKFIAHNTFLTEKNVDKTVQTYSIAADCLDTWNEKLLLNDACVRKNIPFVHAAIGQFSGQILPIIPKQTACLRCLDIAPNTDKNILGAAAGAIACLQAVQICNCIADIAPVNGLFMLDTLNMESVLLPVEKNKNCICNA